MTVRLLAVINVAVYVCFVVTGEGLQLAVVPAAILSGHGFATLILSQFLQTNVLHVVGNLMFLFAFGQGVEERLGSVWTLVLYLICGLCGMLAQVGSSALLFPDSFRLIPIYGASGAIAGILGAYVVINPSQRVRFRLVVRSINPPIWAVLLTWFAVSVVAGLAGPTNIGHAAHVAGFLIGATSLAIFKKQKFPYREGLVSKVTHG